MVRTQIRHSRMPSSIRQTRRGSCSGDSPVYVHALTQARATQHRLAQAEVAAQVRLARAQAVAQAFAFVSEGRQSMDSGSQDAPLEHVADDIASQVYGVLEAVDQLRAAAPLHVPLLAAPLPGGAADKHEWDQGRDEYLNWEAQRIMGALKRQAT